MKKTILFALFSLSLSPVALFADFEVSNWKYEKQINAPALVDTQYVRLPLDSDVSSAGDFKGIRIINEKNIEIPYQLIKEEYISKSSGGVLINNSTDSQGRSYFTIDLGVSGQIHNQILVQTQSSNYRRQVSVYASDTLLPESSSAWKLLTDKGYIYKFTDQSVGLNVAGNLFFYPKSTARYVKVVIGAGPEGAIAVSGAQVFQQEVRTNISRDMEIRGSVGDDVTNKATVLTFDLGSTGVFTNEVTVSTREKNFNRRVILESSNDGLTWNYLSQGFISYLETSLFSGGSLSLNYPEVMARYIRLKVFNQDDQPLSFETKAKFKGPVYSVVFQSNPAQDYRLFYGNSTASKPFYDLARLFQYLEVDTMTEATLGRQLENQKYVPPAPPKVPFTESNKYLLNVSFIIYY